MTREPIEVTRQDRIYCLKANSDYHSEVCEECKFYPNCDHMTQDDMTELIIKDLEVLEQEPKTGHWEWQTNSDLETTLCLLPKIQSEDGQDYVQLADVLETVRRYKPSVDKPQERSEE